MKKTAILITLAVSAAIFIHSCSFDSGTGTVVCTSYATYVISTSGTYFVTDDSLRVVPNNTLGTGYVNGERLLLTWSFDAGNGITDPIYADISSTTGLMQGQSFMTDNTDTLGTAGADMYLYGEGNPIWRSGGIYEAPCMINILFEYLTNNNGSAHEVYLSYPSEPFDTDGYFHMKLSHNTTDKTKLALIGQDFCSFTLPSWAYKADTKGLVIEFDGLYEESTFYKYTYATCVMEKL